jgi:hypothetical protein
VNKDRMTPINGDWQRALKEAWDRRGESTAVEPEVIKINPNEKENKEHDSES